ncbi:MAG TPA: response regulator [Pyrinomonadaceae bacterium]|nr:response regulator [Pyrinomonadaceae bacterium]
MNLPPRILYVDDDPIDCELMAFWLNDSCGYDVTSAMDGQQAAEYIAKQTFDLFLLDYCLPDTTAVHLCQKIRETNPFVPIMIYSSLNREVDKQQARIAGANDYLVKPEELHLVKSHIDMLLGRALDGQMTLAAVQNEASQASIPRNNPVVKRRASRIL